MEVKRLEAVERVPDDESIPFGPHGSLFRATTRDTVAISVSDGGPGVKPTERQTIFDSFVRFDTGSRTGLGLAMAKAFVEAHGGRIWVEEALRKGATFVFNRAARRHQGAMH